MNEEDKDRQPGVGFAIAFVVVMLVLNFLADLGHLRTMKTLVQTLVATQPVQAGEARGTEGDSK